MPQETKVQPDPNSPTGVAGGNAPSLAGWTVDLSDPTTTLDVLEKAFDYRGDVTLTLSDGRAITGYIFDRHKGKTLDDSFVRLMLSDAAAAAAPGQDRAQIPYSQIRRVEFSSRDPAAGKSFETWVKKYIEKKLKGEKASIESEHV